jgi:hypothetical protein
MTPPLPAPGEDLGFPPESSLTFWGAGRGVVPRVGAANRDFSVWSQYSAEIETAS